MRAFKIIAKAAVSFYEELFFYFIAGLAHLLCWLLVIPGPFALAGIYTIGQRAVRGQGVKWRLIWQGIKEFGLRSFFLFLITLLGFAIILSNLYFYNNPELSPFPDSVALWITPLFIVLGVMWTAVVFYAQAFLMELKEPTIPIVLRNSLFLAVLKPLPTLICLLASAIVIVISVLLPILLIPMPGFISVLSITAVRTLIGDISEQAEQKDNDEEDSEEQQADSEPDDETMAWLAESEEDR